MGFAVVACGLAAAIFAVGYLGPGGDGIQRGVEVGGLELGGMTREEARETIARGASSAFEGIELKSGEDTFALPGEALGVTVDAADAAERAYRVGREDGVFGRAWNSLRSYLGGGVTVATGVSYDRVLARRALENLAREEFNRAPKEASFSVNETGEVEVVESQSGRVLNVEATLANLDSSLGDLSGNEGKPVALAAEKKAPGLTTEEARALAPRELVSEYKTDYAWDPDPNRKANLRMASGAIDNTVLAPGEVFSANAALAGLDYEAAKVFTDGGVAYEEGGGLCQVSSTMFMAASYAGLEIVERNQHYAELPYIKPGFDATVWFGGSGIPELDMKFKNTTDGYLLVREFVDKDGFLTAQIYANKPTGKKVIMNTEKVSQSTTDGIKWVTSKKITGAKGEVLFDDVLYESTYSYNPPVPAEMKHETNDPRTAGWLDPQNTTGWAEVD